jgi:hypothetical protein
MKYGRQKKKQAVCSGQEKRRRKSSGKHKTYKIKNKSVD